MVLLDSGAVNMGLNDTTKFTVLVFPTTIGAEQLIRLMYESPDPVCIAPRPLPEQPIGVVPLLNPVHPGNRAGAPDVVSQPIYPR